MGYLIISIDCEGLWGVTDQIEKYTGIITQESLLWAYRSLISLLETLGLPATFAFVGLFTSQREDIVTALDGLRESSDHRTWLEPAYRAIAGNEMSGWHLPEALNWVMENPQHEIASHSLTHLPLHSASDPMRAFRIELDGVAEWSLRSSQEIKTYIFPRNQVVGVGNDFYHDGFVGFRDALRHESRFRRVLAELNVRQKAQVAPPSQIAVKEQCVPIPSGFICHWRCGPRRLIPITATRARWRSISRDAACGGDRVAHLWLHPHNLITGKRQLDLLSLILQDAMKFVRKGDLVPVTQRQFVEDLHSGALRGATGSNPLNPWHEHPPSSGVGDFP